MYIWNSYSHSCSQYWINERCTKLALRNAATDGFLYMDFGRLSVKIQVKMGNRGQQMLCDVTYAKEKVYPHCDLSVLFQRQLKPAS